MGVDSPKNELHIHNVLYIKSRDTCPSNRAQISCNGCKDTLYIYNFRISDLGFLINVDLDNLANIIIKIMY
jgi:hypothetical protein